MINGKMASDYRKKRDKTWLVQRGNANITLLSPEVLRAMSTATDGVKLCLLKCPIFEAEGLRMGSSEIRTC